MSNQTDKANEDIRIHWERARESTRQITQTEEYQRMWRMVQFGCQQLLVLREQRNMPRDSPETKMLLNMEVTAADYCARCETWLAGARVKHDSIMRGLVE